jgi:hypothetical protein
MASDIQQRANGDFGEEAQEAVLRELIRAAVEIAFGSATVVGSSGVATSINLISYDGGISFQSS